MRWLAFLTFVITSISLLIGIAIISEMSHKNKEISKSEMLLEECRKENKHLKDTLGVFYNPRKESENE